MSDERLSPIVNVDTQHETSDVNVRAVVWFAVIFVAFAVVMHVALWFFFQGLVKSERRKGGPPLTAIRRPSDASVPQNQPLLQPFPRKSPGGEVQSPTQNTPVTDLAVMRAAEEQALTTYGWVDQQRGIVRLPIEVAKKLAVERGMPGGGR